MNNRKNASVAIEKQSSLEKKIKKIIAKEDLTANKALIEVSARHLKIDYLDLAAALLFMSDTQPKLSELTSHKFSMEKQKAHKLLHAEMVQYRIEVGRIHKVSVNLIKEILVEEVGVEYKKIGYINIFEDYTTLSLPPGMPVEILQTFKNVKINLKALDIKHLSGTSKKNQSDKHFHRGTQTSSGDQ